MDENVAYILGLLHDIGRREGIHGMRHSLDGYNFAMKYGYDLVARICLTHVSFIYIIEPVVIGKWDGTEDKLEKVLCILKDYNENDYDMLIKLCDYDSLPEGFCLLENVLLT